MTIFFAKLEEVNRIDPLGRGAKTQQNVNVQKPISFWPKLEDYGLPLHRKIKPCT